MTETNTNLHPDIPQPLIVYGKNVASTTQISPLETGQTMLELNTSHQAISDTVVYADPKNRLLNLGTHYPNTIGRLRFFWIPQIRNAKGDVVRLSTRVKGEDRTDVEMNHTLVHELEHVAQEDRDDPKLTQGHIAIWGLAAIGALLGNRAGKSKAVKAATTLAGSAAGYGLGYLVAPHERQARARAKTVTTSAVSSRK